MPGRVSGDLGIPVGLVTSQDTAHGRFILSPAGLVRLVLRAQVQVRTPRPRPAQTRQRPPSRGDSPGRGSGK